MSAFQVGREIGKVNSPVSGIGDAIRNILDNARKRGLLQDQSIYQAQGSIQADAAKRTAEEAERNLPQDVTFVGASPAQDRTISTTRGGAENVKTLPAVAENTLQTASRMAAELEASKKASNAATFPTDDTGGTLAERAGKFLQDNGARITPANIQAVIEKGMVK